MPRSLSMPQLICCHGVANFDGTYLEEFQKFCQGVSEVVCHSHAILMPFSCHSHAILMPSEILGDSGQCQAKLACQGLLSAD